MPMAEIFGCVVRIRPNRRKPIATELVAVPNGTVEFEPMRNVTYGRMSREFTIHPGLGLVLL